MKKLLLFSILFLYQIFQAQSDCISAIPVCGNSDISYNPSSSGTIQEATSGSCLGLEHYSVWYVFTAATSGTIEFTINPNTVPGVTHYDYDFAVYGPNIDCATWDFGNAIRCNYSGTSGPTGLSSTITGGQWELPLNVIAGEKYYLLIDNFIPSNPYGFSLTWGGTATLTSAFNNPALTPHPFITPGVPNATDPAAPNEILKCSLPTLFNFSTLTTGIINGNPNFSVTYHNTNNDAITGQNPITAPIMVDGTTIYYYRLKYTDPTNPTNPINGCFLTGKFKFKKGNITASDATIYACNNNNVGTGSFDLTTAAVYSGTATKKYYPTLNDLNAGTNEITNPTNYISTQKKVYVKVTTSDGCFDDSEITLTFYPLVVVKEATLESCFIEGNITTAAFDLTSANISVLSNPQKKFYTTLANATSGTNEILNATNYISMSGSVYARVYSGDQCYSITKITLVVLPPVKSAVLKNKTICVEDRTTLDAGPGFVSYEWSTGATTQSIQGVPVGAYWVKLQTGKCFTLQQVNVYPSNQPVISNIEITNNTITVTANGGTAPYKYSLDGTHWQDSNVFTGVPRGENKIYVIDAYDCTPIEVQVTVPNLLNAITPNGDNVNDFIDYSELAYKKNLVFIVYDRYGNKLYEAGKIRDYRWDGTASGKKILTGTYWFSISWNENDKNNTQTKYSGWILVKNRE
ncbi:T9SS type B sorting domain-containing protein [Chryseobacterium gwangjuense]|uniref:T9SS type B sorting domain-containing protein n=1 Tax=Chryseobacterium gwangjuense TaxID=1069980 RepID=UPI001E642CE6|nr:T9SS type B sorting domain-containing protein [Chryseobacterium gwangjuense]MCE3075406.1 gliding motility-associated C-terminal domain-containing protein [Chryseobacterium gwangjuense]